MQQAQVNLLADMGAQPATRDAALVAATAAPTRPARRSPSPRPPRGHRRQRQPASPSPARPPTPAASWPASRSPPTAATRWHPAHRQAVLDLHVHPEGTRLTPASGSARSTTAPTSAPRPRETSNSAALHCLRHSRCRLTPDRRTAAPTSLGMQFTPTRGRLHHRSPFLQEHGKHRHPRRLALELQPDNGWQRPRSPRKQPQAGRRSCSASR